MIDLIKRFFGLNGYKKHSRDYYDEMLDKKKKQTRELKKMNRKFRILLQQGKIEVIIKNVDGIFTELKK